LVVLAALLGISSTAAAQTAELRGAVVDASGGTLPGVTVAIVNASTGVARTAVTDDQGVFRVPALQPGPYAIEFLLQGFGTEKRNVVLTVGQVADIKITLAVGASVSPRRSAGRTFAACIPCRSTAASWITPFTASPSSR